MDPRELAPQRRWARLARRPDCELWLICWPPGSLAPLHDHGGATGGAVVLAGTLIERAWVTTPAPGWKLTSWTPGSVHSFGANHLHEVANRSERVAYSVHVYAPRLDSMTFYAEAENDGLVARETRTEGMWS